MNFAAWAREHVLAASVVFLFVATLTAVSAVGAVAWLFASLLVGGSTAATLGTLLPAFLVGLVVGVPLSVVTGAGVSYGLAARVANGVSAWLTGLGVAVSRGAEAAERRSVLARVLSVAALGELFDPRTPAQRADDRVERLKTRYAEGELSLAEFEHQTQAVLAEEDVSRDQVSTLDDQLARNQPADADETRADAGEAPPSDADEGPPTQPEPEPPEHEA